MRLWIDGQCLQTASRLRGIGRSLLGLIEGLTEAHPEIELHVSLNAALPDEALAARDHLDGLVARDRIRMWQGIAEGGEALVGRTPARRMSEIALAHHVACLAPDAALVPSVFEGSADETVPLAPSPILGLPLVGIFHDAIPHHFPARYLPTPESRACHAARLAHFAAFDLTLCVSDYARRDLAALVPAARLATIGAGLSARLRALIRPRIVGDRAGGPRTILHVGGLDWRKNLGLVVEAIGRLPEFLRDETRLVLAGSYEAGAAAALRRRWREAGLADASLVTSGAVGDEQLMRLYAEADLVVLPSRLEGFGLTALEAMACSVPVVATDRGAPPELIGDPALLFDPDDAEALARLLLRVLTDAGFAAAAGAGGEERARPFRWERTARRAVAALREVAPPREGPVPDLTAIRRRTLAAIPAALSPDILAPLLAAAEPWPAQPGRLFVDAATAALPARSGIAVTRRDNAIWPLAEFGSSSARGIRLGPHDVVVMGDASWDGRYLPLLRGRLNGARIVWRLDDVEAIPDATRPPSSRIAYALALSTAILFRTEADAARLRALLVRLAFARPLVIAVAEDPSAFLRDPAGFSPGATLYRPTGETPFASVLDRRDLVAD